MTPSEVRKLGRALTRVRLKLSANEPISDWRIAQTIAPELGVSTRAVMAWLAGEYEPTEPVMKLLRLLAK